MAGNYDREVSTVAGGLYHPVTVNRSERAWGLGDGGYDFDYDTGVVEVAYPDPASLAAAERPVGFSVALAASAMVPSVEVTFTKQGQ